MEGRGATGRAETRELKMARGLGERIASGRLFRRLKMQAMAYARDPQKLRDIVAHATRKADASGRSGPLGEVWEGLRTLFRLLRAYAKGDYRQVPTATIVLVLAAVLYFLTPVDLIPDFIFGLGFVDDVAIVTWVLAAAKTVLDDFTAWEQRTQRGPLVRASGE